jgi:hypothetical protein
MMEENLRKYMGDHVTAETEIRRCNYLTGVPRFAGKHETLAEVGKDCH